MLCQTKPLILPLACALPSVIVYNVYKNHDSRGISEHEIGLSHTRLAALQVPNEQVAPVTKDEPHAVARRNQLLALIDSSGVASIPRLLNDDRRTSWKHNLHAAMHENGSQRVRNNRGRLHSHQESRRDPYNSRFHHLVSSLLELQSIVELYFRRNSISRYRMTQIQFLLAKPGSEHQIWHRDNVAPGLTLLVALDDVKSNGPTGRRSYCSEVTRMNMMHFVTMMKYYWDAFEQEMLYYTMLTSSIEDVGTRMRAIPIGLF